MRTKVRRSASQVVLSRMQLALRETRRTLPRRFVLGARDARLVDEMKAMKTRRASCRRCRGARGNGRKTTNVYTKLVHPPLSSRLSPLRLTFATIAHAEPAAFVYYIFR